MKIDRQRLFDIETNSNLFQLSLFNVKIYELIRFMILSPKLSKSSNRQTLQVSYTSLKIIFKNLRNIVFFLKCNLQKNIVDMPIFVSASRRHRTDQYAEDIYIDPLVKDIEKYVIIDFSPLEHSEHIFDLHGNKYINLHFLMLLISLFASLQSRILPFFLKKSIERASDKIYSNINQILPYSLSKKNLKKIMLYHVAYFTSFEILGRSLFAHSSSCKIYFVDFLGFEGLISAAKRVGMQTYELQHGSPQKNKFNYDFSVGIAPLSYRCKHFLSWGPFFENAVNLPYQSVIKFGFPYLHQKYNRRTASDKKSVNSLLVISQPEVSAELLHAAKNFASKNRGWDLIYKCHPYEDIQNAVTAFSEIPNVCVTKNHDLHSLFDRCRCAVGVYSTALIEACHYGLDIAILELAGHEKMQDFIQLNFAIKIKDFEQLNAAIFKTHNEGLFYTLEPNISRCFFNYS